MVRSLPLTLFWVVYMGSVGIVLPYYSLYLKENAGLAGTELGSVFAVLPPVGSALGYLVLAAAGGFWAILFATATIAVFGTAVLPITISVSLAILRDAGPHAFGFVRVWGA